MTKKLIERLDKGPVICAEGFLFEMEKRGYLTSGEFVPMLALDNPEALESLHKDFQQVQFSQRFRLLTVLLIN